MSNYNYVGLMIGAIVTAISLLLTFAYVLPFFSIVLCFAAKTMFVFCANYKTIATVAIVFLSIAFLVVMALVLWNIRNMVKEGLPILATKMILIMLIFFVIVHPLGFYIYWASHHFKALAIFESRPCFAISSLAFIIIGFIIDIVKNNIVPEQTSLNNRND
jgi:hypothetical protein